MIGGECGKFGSELNKNKGDVCEWLSVVSLLRGVEGEVWDRESGGTSGCVEGEELQGVVLLSITSLGSICTPSYSKATPHEYPRLGVDTVEVRWSSWLLPRAAVVAELGNVLDGETCPDERGGWCEAKDSKLKGYSSCGIEPVKIAEGDGASRRPFNATGGEG